MWLLQTSLLPFVKRELAASSSHLMWCLERLDWLHEDEVRTTLVLRKVMLKAADKSSICSSNWSHTKWRRSSICDHQSGVVSACHVPALNCQAPSYYQQKVPSVFPDRACSRWEDKVSATKMVLPDSWIGSDGLRLTESTYQPLIKQLYKKCLVASWLFELD